MSKRWMTFIGGLILNKNDSKTMCLITVWLEYSWGKALVTRLLLDPTYHDRVNFQLSPPTIFRCSRIYFSPAKAQWQWCNQNIWMIPMLMLVFIFAERTNQVSLSFQSIRNKTFLWVNWKLLPFSSKSYSSV